MAVRGVPQLKQLLIRYSDLDGSSKGIREWMKNNLIEFAKLNPHITIRTELKRCRHPFLRGSYLNGNEKTIGIKNLEIPAIESYVKHLRMQIGRKIAKTSGGYKTPVLTTRPSIQGEWNERLDLLDMKFTIIKGQN